MLLTSEDLKKLEHQVNHILKDAGLHILKYWHKIKSVKYKDKRDVVTDVDIQVENMLRQELHLLLPEAGFIVEEGQSDSNKKYEWVIDPIDGTKNYHTHLPVFVTQVALLYDKKPILGSIYNPVSQQLFSASLHNGSRLNGVNVRAKTAIDPDRSIIDIDFGGNDEEMSYKLKVFELLAGHFFRVRIFGGIFSVYMLTGAFDAYLIMNKKNKIVDIMPNFIILNESGFKTEYLHIPPLKNVFLAAQPQLFMVIEQLLRKNLISSKLKSK